MKPIRCTIVTPEKKVLDCETLFAAIPLQDGEVGIAAGRAPLVGRLGRGELRLDYEGGVQGVFYVEGGFVELSNDVITVLTDFAVQASRLRPAKLEIDLETARNMPKTGPDAKKREEAIARTKAMLHVARRNSRPTQ